MYWGANRGCAFASDKCISNVGGVPTVLDDDHYCTGNTDSCLVDYTSRSVCSSRTYPSPISPSYDQYFGNANVGGASFPDYCPINGGYLGGDCTIQSNLQYPTGTTINLLGETYCSNCRCAKSTLLTTSNKGWSYPSRKTGCYSMSCTSGVITIQVASGSGFVNATCTQKGQAMTLNGFTGTLYCPDPYVICQKGTCSPSCGANAICFSGTCICLDGYTKDSYSSNCISVCPDACSYKGVCDTKTTTCTCNTGYSGINCSTNATETTLKTGLRNNSPPVKYMMVFHVLLTFVLLICFM